MNTVIWYDGYSDFFSHLKNKIIRVELVGTVEVTWRCFL